MGRYRAETKDNFYVDLVARYAKSIASALSGGLLYLLTVLAPEATIESITLVQWIGFIASIIVPGGVVAAVPNRTRDRVV